MSLIYAFLFAACVDSDNKNTGQQSYDTGQGVDCTSQFVHSLVLTIVDQDGEPLDNAIVSYTVDGVEGTFVEYFSNGEYFVGGEEAGDFEVDIYVEVPLGDDCFDIGNGTESLVVEADVCHVITQYLSPDLEWSRVCLD